MQAYYLLKSGKKAKVFLNDELLRDECYRGFVEVSDADWTEQRLVKKTTYRDKCGKLYFKWNNERVYINDFIYENVDEFIRKLNAFRNTSAKDFFGKIKESSVEYKDICVDAFVSMLNKSNNVGFVCSHQMTMALAEYLSRHNQRWTPNDDVELLFVPYETPNSTKEWWDCRICLIPYNQEISNGISAKSYYTSDLHKLLLDGDIKLVNTDTYLNVNDVFVVPYNEPSKIASLIQKIFGRKIS